MKRALSVAKLRSLYHSFIGRRECNTHISFPLNSAQRQLNSSLVSSKMHLTALGVLFGLTSLTLMCCDQFEWCSDVESKTSVFEDNQIVDLSSRELIGSLPAMSNIHCAILCQRRTCYHYVYDEETEECKIFSNTYTKPKSNNAGSDHSKVIYSTDVQGTASLVSSKTKPRSVFIAISNLAIMQYC